MPYAALHGEADGNAVDVPTRTRCAPSPSPQLSAPRIDLSALVPAQLLCGKVSTHVGSCWFWVCLCGCSLPRMGLVFEPVDLGRHPQETVVPTDFAKLQMAVEVNNWMASLLKPPPSKWVLVFAPPPIPFVHASHPMHRAERRLLCVFMCMCGSLDIGRVMQDGSLRACVHHVGHKSTPGHSTGRAHCHCRGGSGYVGVHACVQVGCAEPL